jgi:hypothetical protein
VALPKDAGVRVSHLRRGHSWGGHDFSQRNFEKALVRKGKSRGTDKESLARISRGNLELIQGVDVFVNLWQQA